MRVTAPHRRPSRSRGWLAVVVAASCLTAAGTAWSDPHTEHFHDLAAITTQRRAALEATPGRRERAQARVLRGIEREISGVSRSVRADVITARRIATRLDRRFPDDVLFGPELGFLTAELRAEARLRWDAVSDDVERRLTDRPLDVARRSVSGADTLLARAESEDAGGGSRQSRRVLGMLARALAVLGRAERSLAARGGEPVQTALLTPIARIAHPDIKESSGLAYTGGAYWTHNDSGGAAVLYRSESATFEDAETLTVPGALAVDWEDITVLDGDLVIGDFGDNLRVREDLVLYRVRYVPATEPGPGSLVLVATYPFEYPDGRHDCEAAYVRGGRVHLVIKSGAGDGTDVYRFDALTDASELPQGQRNVPVKVASLTLPQGEQVTAAQVHRETGPLVLLTYFRVHVVDADLASLAPLRSVPLMLLITKQCEGAAFVGDRLVFTNEQREVFGAHDFLTRK